jgi:hypothetical protein
VLALNSVGIAHYTSPAVRGAVVALPGALAGAFAAIAPARGAARLDVLLALSAQLGYLSWGRRAGIDTTPARRLRRVSGVALSIGAPMAR